MLSNNYQFKSLEWPVWVLLPVVFGYVTMTRSFAHLGVAPLYVGEATLGVLLFFWPRTILGTWFRTQLRLCTYTPLTTLAAVFVAYGLFQCARGLIFSAYPKTTLQNVAFNYYIAFLFAGMWLGDRHPKLLRQAIWILAWVNAVYGIAYLLKFGAVIPPEEQDPSIVPTFGWPAGSAIAILGLLAYEGITRRSIVPLALNTFVLIGNQVRAEWLGFALAILLLSILLGRLSRLILAGAFVAVLVAVTVVVDLRIPATSGRDGVISARGVVGRAVAAVDEDAAAQLTDYAGSYSGTVSWRTEWWSILLDLVHQHPKTALFGLGYGYPIWDYNRFIDNINPTPHNIFMYVLAYTGWVGVFIFYSLQFYLAWLLWRSYRASGQPFGICLWVLLFAWAHFDNRLETPYGAIPFWVLIGMALTSAFAAAKSEMPLVASSRRFPG